MIRTVLAALSAFACMVFVSTAQAQVDVRALQRGPALSSVVVSPNGQHLAAVTLPSGGGPPEVSVWRTDSLNSPPVTFRPPDVRVFGVNWLSNDQLGVFGNQTFDLRTSGGSVRDYNTKFYIVDREGRNFREPMDRAGIARFASERFADALAQPELLARLPNQPDTWLVTLTSNRAADIYALNVRTMQASTVMRGDDRDGGYLVDQAGEVRGRLRIDFSSADPSIAVLLRAPGSQEWVEHFRILARDRATLNPLGFGADPNILYIASDQGRNNTAIYEYNIATRQLGEPIFEAQGFDISGVILGGEDGDDSQRGQLLGFDIAGPFPTVYWLDPARQALTESLKASLPGANARDMSVYLGSASRDGSARVAIVAGPREPGAYYLIRNGREVTPLGRSYPAADPAQMAEVRFQRYAARDGVQIPAYITVPRTGSAPYPTIVMPHGGPWARDYDGVWDRWAQTLAAQGYLVLQPQFRGSEGWGQELWRAGDREWGGKMQDDKDDGARWLIQQGLADPNRIAMFGFSYGGYSAMAASVRPNGLYQCAIAGAGVSELRTIDRLTFENRFQRALQNPTIAGMSPLDQARDVSIPIFVFHGNRDQIVPIEQSERFVSALRSAGKQVRYLEIDNMPHGDIWPDQSVIMWDAIFSYLRDECGEGGL